MITNIFEFHRMLNERAFTIDDTTNCVLLRSSTQKELKLCLYDYVDEKIVGYITATKDKRNDYYITDRATADKGWGPFMYTLLLYSVYPLGVKPSALIRPAALNIYKQFAKNPKIQTTKIPNTDLHYADTWQPDVELMQREAPEETAIINTVYKLQPEPWFQPFVTESENIVLANDISANDIFRYCLNYWQHNYDSTRKDLAVSESATLVAPSKDVSDKYLIVRDRTSSVEFMIQDKGKIFGYAELLKKPSYYNIVNVAAEDSWGPFLYDTIMLYLDKPVRPNRSLTIEAWNVWNKYCNSRADVTKIEIPDTWDTVDLDHQEMSSSNLVEPVNYAYTIRDNGRKEFVREWTKDSDAFVQKLSAQVPDFKNKRFTQAKMWNERQYNKHLEN